MVANSRTLNSLTAYSPSIDNLIQLLLYGQLLSLIDYVLVLLLRYKFDKKRYYNMDGQLYVYGAFKKKKAYDECDV